MRNAMGQGLTLLEMLVTLILLGGSSPSCSRWSPSRSMDTDVDGTTPFQAPKDSTRWKGALRGCYGDQRDGRGFRH